MQSRSERVPNEERVGLVTSTAWRASIVFRSHDVATSSPALSHRGCHIESGCKHFSGLWL